MYIYHTQKKKKKKIQESKYKQTNVNKMVPWMFQEYTDCSFMTSIIM